MTKKQNESDALQKKKTTNTPLSMNIFPFLDYYFFLKNSRKIKK
jgi:hypothetical protein